MPVLDVRDVTVRFQLDRHHVRTVLDRATTRVERGEVVGLLGPSGSGKSTLLRVIAGLQPVDGGSVWLDCRDVTHVATHLRGVGLMFQDEQLFPHRTVGENIGFGLRMAGVAADARRTRVTELLALTGLDGFGDRPVTTLSGGERKRVALARSLAPQPKVLLLDEPLTGLDRHLHDRLATELTEILRSARTTSLMVTHDPQEAAAICDRTVELTGLCAGGVGTVGDDG